jgi:hypothetical protein
MITSPDSAAASLDARSQFPPIEPDPGARRPV